MEMRLRQDSKRERLTRNTGNRQLNCLTPFLGNYIHGSRGSIHVYSDAERVIEELSKKYIITMITNGASDLQWEKIKKLSFKDKFNQIIVAHAQANCEREAEKRRKSLGKVEAQQEIALTITT